MTTSTWRDATPSSAGATSRYTSGKGDALQLQISDSSDDDMPLLSFKLSALTNALLDSENQQEEDTYPRRHRDRRNELSANQTDNNNAEW